MGGTSLTSGSGRAHRHILRHLRSHLSCEPLKPSSAPSAAPLNHLLPQRHQQLARVFVGSRRVASKFKEPSPSSQVSSPGASSVLSSSAKVAAAAAAAPPSCTSARGGGGFVSWYLRMLKTRPVLTKSLTASAIFTAADVSSQKIVGSSNLPDMGRTLRMAGYGLLVSGPSLHLWFNFVSRVLPKRDILTTCKKIFIGQILFGPFITAIFFSFNAKLQGETAAEILERLKRDLIPTLKTGIMYWPICDFITFKFFPVGLQPLLNNSFSFLWTIYLIYMANLKKAGTEEIAATD